MAPSTPDPTQSTYTGKDRWWLVLAAVPLLFLSWLALSVVSLTIARVVPVWVTGLLTEIQGAIVVASYLVSLAAPLVIHHDRQFVAARSRWSPSVLYYLAVIPLANVVVTGLYLWRRHRYVGRP
ncbi:hypothetical protein [Salinigranum sp. GCM10025319]|uniref:hypothetical protein n=1 Tax=Salinigranum sp. GCM10025319 TaxID=3252687 RepID=UPI0036211928